MGDTPYTASEAKRLDFLVDDLNAAAPAFVVHVGDIGRPREACTDAGLEARRRQFSRIQAPFVLLPGDNEWTDCQDPAARLAAWRKVFCRDAKLGSFERQSGPYCEHVRWVHEDLVYVALNVPGSQNNIGQPEEAGPRMAAALSWLEEGARAAASRKGLVVLMQADPFISLPRDGYAALRDRLIELGQRLPGRVTLVHGDTHLWRDDEPWPGVRRIEVWGSPFVSFLLVPFGPGGLGTSSPRHR